MRADAVKKAVKYEEKARQSEKKIIVECKCMKEIEKRRESGEENKWEKKRKRILEEVNMGKELKKKGRRRY